MSLINQMLRDLEQRDPAAPLPGQPSTAVQRRRRISRWWWLTLLLPAIALYRNPSSSIHPSTSPAPDAPQAVAINDKALETMILIPPNSPVLALHISVKPNPPLILKPLSLKSTNTSGVKTALKTDKSATGLYQQAKQYSSRLMQTETLREALQLDPNYLPARTLLLQILLQSHATHTELGNFVEDSLSHFPSNPFFIKTRAQLYVQQRDFTAAIQLLERLDSDSVSDNGYLALQAASYQQLQRFPEAVKLYSKLTQNQADKAENWLGLGICLDKLNQTPAASLAYQQALDKNTLNADVVSYIKQRLSAMTP